MDSPIILKAILGHVLKINYLVYEESDDPIMAIGFGVLESYVELVD
tara:strand:+ start:308 stop:445 length:138 start_codon:yes stop_codon:yes gene_type:complete